MRLIIQHFLLVTTSPPAEPRQHWLDEVDEFRSQIEDKLIPRIRRDVEAAWAAIYGRARRNAARKMRRSGEAAAVAALPEACPYTLEQILGDWEPDASHEPQ